MVFSAPVFLFLFLPLFLLVYYLTPERHRTGWILAGSWLFYGLWRADFLPLLAAVTAGNWLAGLYLDRSVTKDGRDKRDQRLLAATVALNLLVLGYFKYFNFGVDSLNSLLKTMGLAPLRGWSVILPVGISFYIFQSMSYIIDVYRGDAPAARNFVDLAAYVALFPQLIAGPILRYKDMAGQFRERTHSVHRAAYGLRRFTVGLCRKVLIADTVAPIANAVFSLPSPGMAGAWLGVLAYAVQLYFDFSGYSDMAVGLGHMMGFTFMENFDAPYRARSITDFWKRWHISLSSWLKDYLYIPLGGNRHGTARTYLNLLLVMILGGLWHGASWNFVIWGCWHGVLLVLERARRNARSRKGPINTSALCILPTQAAVLMGWVVFRAPDPRSAWRLLESMAGAAGWGLGADLAWRLGGLELVSLAVGLAVIAFEPRKKNRVWEEEAAAHTGPKSALWAALGIAALVKLAADSYSPFLYFQF